jgi:hypothetical protein
MSSQFGLTLIAAFGGGVVASGLTSLVNFLIHRSNLSWQRELRLQDKSEEQQQWILDKKTAECRELLSTLTQCGQCMGQNSIDFGPELPSLLTEEQKRLAYGKAASEGLKTIQDRIFISKRIQDEGVLTLWKSLAGERDFNKFWNSWDWLHGVIVKAAHKELGIEDDKNGLGL